MFGAMVLVGMACVSLLADDADSNHLFESKGSLDAFFGDRPQGVSRPGSPQGPVLIRGRFVRNVPEGMLVKGGKPTSDGTGGIPRVYGLLLLKGYPHRGGLAADDPLQVIAHGDGTTYSFTNMSGVDRTIEVYVFDAVFTPTTSPETDSVPPAPVEAVFPGEGSKQRGSPETRGEDHSHPPVSAPEGSSPAPRTEGGGGEGPAKSSGSPAPDKVAPTGDVPRVGQVPIVPPKS